MFRTVTNWHRITDALGRPAMLGILSCGHLWTIEGGIPGLLPTTANCGVCQAEATAAQRQTIPEGQFLVDADAPQAAKPYTVEEPGV